MDYRELLRSAQDKLASNYDYVVNDIELRIKSGSTGGEIGDSLACYLKKMKD